jgi:CSLREA domain-containing protein
LAGEARPKHTHNARGALLGGSLALVCVCNCALALGTTSASASTLTVNSTADELTPGDGRCSLREAVGEVNAPSVPSADCGSAAAVGNTIVLPGGRYVLSIKGADEDAGASGDLDIAATVVNLTVTGAGAGTTTIDASGLGDRVLTVLNGASVAIQGLEITGGHAPAGAAGIPGSSEAKDGSAGGRGENGGGIVTQGTLALVDVTVRDNAAGAGGAGGDGAEGSTLGSAGGSGGAGGVGGECGGIANLGELELIRTAVTANRAGNGGNGGSGGPGRFPGGAGGAGGVAGRGGAAGAVCGAAGKLTLSDSLISANVAGNGGEGGRGGDGVQSPDGGSVGGTGGTGGEGGLVGGVFTFNSEMSATSSTFSGNFAGAGGPGGSGGTGGSGAPEGKGESGGNGGHGGDGGDGGGGGGLGASFSANTLLNVTITQNAAGGAGGGGVGGLGGSGGKPGSSGSAGGAGSLAAGGGIAGGFAEIVMQNSLVASNGVGGNCSAAIEDAGHNLVFGDSTCPGVNADPKLGPLQDDGGPTPTVAPGPGSAAIDGVPAAGAGCPSSDQRGVPRPSGPACDIGAYEVAAPVAVTGPATGIGTDVATVTATMTAYAGDAGIYFQFGPTTAYGTQSSVQHVGGVTPTPVSAALSGLAPNTTYHYRVVATSTDGTGVGADQTFTTAAITRVASPTASKASIYALRATYSVFVVAGASTALTGKTAARGHHKGTVFSFGLDQPANVKIAIQALSSGRRIKGRCRPASPKLRSKHRCTRTITVHTLTRTGHAGVNKVAFSGRIAGRALRPGRYRAVFTAITAAGASPSHGLSFTIVRR